MIALIVIVLICWVVASILIGPILGRMMALKDRDL